MMPMITEYFTLFFSAGSDVDDSGADDNDNDGYGQAISVRLFVRLCLSDVHVVKVHLLIDGGTLVVHGDCGATSAPKL